MKALVYILGARALDVTHDHEPRQARSVVPEPAFLPIASTPETAGAWRRWAEAGRTSAARAARPQPSPATWPATSGGNV